MEKRIYVDEENSSGYLIVTDDPFAVAEKLELHIRRAIMNNSYLRLHISVFPKEEKKEA